MSRGNRIVKVRVEPELLQRIEWQIQHRNDHTDRMPWVMSDWIRVAMIEKLAKMVRSRRPRKRAAT